jgi:hypothetical protein
MVQQGKKDGYDTNLLIAGLYYGFIAERYLLRLDIGPHSSVFLFGSLSLSRMDRPDVSECL